MNFGKRLPNEQEHQRPLSRGDVGGSTPRAGRAVMNCHRRVYVISE